MNKTVSLLSSLAVTLCFAAAAMGQAGAPTQRVHIPGRPDGTSIYPPMSMKLADDKVSVGCVNKAADGAFTIVDWRGAGEASVAGAPKAPDRPPLILRLQGDKDMLNFQVGHEVQITGPILELDTPSKPALVKVESLLYLSRTCWKRGTNTDVAAKPQP
jgi:hypothetical protein